MTHVARGSGEFPAEWVASAALLLECARVDWQPRCCERLVIDHALRARYALDAATRDRLLREAERRLDAVWHDWLFTHAVRRDCELPARRSLVDALRRVADADGCLHPLEALLIERIATALGAAEAA